MFENNVLSSMKLAIVGLALLGVLSLMLENIFYGYVDQNGVLQESFFLPLGVFLLLASIIVSVLLLHRSRKNTPLGCFSGVASVSLLELTDYVVENQDLLIEWSQQVPESLEIKYEKDSVTVTY